MRQEIEIHLVLCSRRIRYYTQLGPHGIALSRRVRRISARGGQFENPGGGMASKSMYIFRFIYIFYDQLLTSFEYDRLSVLYGTITET